MTTTKVNFKLLFSVLKLSDRQTLDQSVVYMTVGPSHTNSLSLLKMRH